MSSDSPSYLLIGERLAVNFANVPSRPGLPRAESLTWEELIGFLETSEIVSPERGAKLLTLTQTDPQSAERLLSRAVRLRGALREILGAMIRGKRIEHDWIRPINEILRVTEGHDEMIWSGEAWRIEFVAREEALEWLLAAIARSGAELLAEGPKARLRFCANPACSLIFCDASRTHRRRWCTMSLCGNRSKVAAFARRKQKRKSRP
jgi:predicted RNA-binding Zn ribbon-like protein